jgi:putative glutamine amidotransferase
MKMAPVIGIPCRQDMGGNGRPTNAQSSSYIKAVIQAGGIPFLIPVELDEEALRTIYQRVDGILLAGGGDIDPCYFQEEPHASLSGVQAERDRIELCLTRWAAAEDKPLLGICRGIQVMAVAVGGSLWQDIAAQFLGTQPVDYVHSNWHQARNLLTHTVTLESDSPLAKLVGQTTLPVNSLHHQAVKAMPAPYRVIGLASDGVIEAIDRPDHPFFWGVQWHPEELVEDQEDARQLFSAFVEACRTVLSTEPPSAVVG